MSPAGRYGVAAAAACSFAAAISALPRTSPREAKACNDLDSCIQALVAAAEPGAGIGRQEERASKAVLAFGAEAIPKLLPLLRHEDAEVQDLASYTLRDAPVTEEHLDALIASRLNGDGWIPPAIARIGTPRAIEFLASELKKDPEIGTQLTWAFEILGAKGVPYLLELYECGSECDESLLAVCAYIFSELGDDARAAVAPLLAIAEDARRDASSRRGAIQALGSIGPVAPLTVTRLKAIGAGDPDAFDWSVSRALIDIGGEAATEGRRAEARAQERCRTEGTSEAKRSVAALERLDGRILALESEGDLRQAAGELRSLLASRCFALAAEQGDPPEFDHPLSLREWWTTGGRTWLTSYVERPRLGPVSALREQVVFPPTPRRVLSLDKTWGPVPPSLLCRLADVECGRETQGWAERATEAFSAAVLRERVRSDDAFPASSVALATRCEAEVRKKGGASSYTDWMECLTEHRVKDWALPLGRFRAPDRGWLVVRGRRGHYEFCDQLGAFDVETGATYVARSCSSLHLQQGGSVDFLATNASRRAAFEVGTVNVENLREALWMILLAPAGQQGFLAADYFPIPEGMTPTLPSLEASRVFHGGGWNSGQTRLEWSWITADGQSLASGTLTWPDSYEPPEAHAVALLQIAERGLRAGCPSTVLPAFEPSTHHSGVSTIDARPSDVVGLQGELAAGLRRYASTTCASAGRN